MSTKKKFEMEFVIQASPQLLYQYISTASGLSEWYADNVNVRSEKFTFIWDGNEEEAMLLKKKSDQYVRFQWSHSESPEEFFELRIVVMRLQKMCPCL